MSNFILNKPTKPRYHTSAGVMGFSAIIFQYLHTELHPRMKSSLKGLYFN